MVCLQMLRTEDMCLLLTDESIQIWTVNSNSLVKQSEINSAMPLRHDA